MKSFHPAIATATAVVVSLASQSSLAQGTGQTAASTPHAYASIGAGRSSIALDCEGLSGCDNSGSALRLGAGWRSASGLAAEVLLLNFGKASASVPDAGIDLSVKSRAVGVGGAYFHNFTPDLTGVARLGVARVRSRLEVPGQGSSSQTATRPYFGLGLSWALTPALQAEVTLDLARGKLADDSFQLRAFTVGLGVRF